MNNTINIAAVVAFRDRVAASALPAFVTLDTTGAPAGTGNGADKRSTLGKASPNHGSS